VTLHIYAPRPERERIVRRRCPDCGCTRLRLRVYYDLVEWACTRKRLWAKGKPCGWISRG